MGENFNLLVIKEGGQFQKILKVYIMGIIPVQSVLEYAGCSIFLE